MAKILIAGIGGGKNKKTGEYNRANYSIFDEMTGKDYLFKNRNFVTSVIEDYYKIDKTIYIGTTGSMWENLYSYYCEKYSIKKDEDYEIKLAMEIEQATKDSKIDDINITKFNETFLGKIEAKITKFGMNTNEIFENFNIIMELESKLNDGDEIYIDITHSFRSNAMWMFLIINYITDVLNKNVKIEMITYGMLETQSKNENGDMVAPVVNLKAFFDLMKWIKGANELKRYGNSYTILEMIEDKDTGKKIKAFSDSLNLNYLGTIKRNLKSIERIMEKIELMNGPGKLIIPSIVKEFIEIFGNVEKEYEFLFKLAEWNLNQKRYAMTAININEGLREFIADILEIEDRGNDYNNENSKIMKYFKKIGNNVKYKKIPNSMKGTHQIKEEKIYKIFYKTKNIRNEIAHSIGKKDTTINDIDSLKNYIEDIKIIVNDKSFIKYLEDKNE